MKLSILIPVFNEEASLETLLERVFAVELQKEVIAIDDCSSDQSAEILQRFLSAGLIILHHEKNKGKGAAIRTGLKQATGDYVVIQDADNELSPRDIPKLLGPIQDGKTHVVYGARNLRVQSPVNWLGNSALTFATNILFGIRITDMETCYKLMPTRVMRALDLRSDKFGIEPEITAKLALAGYRIFEVPVSYHPRTLHKKMRPLREGVRALGILLKYRFGTHLGQIQSSVEEDRQTAR